MADSTSKKKQKGQEALDALKGAAGVDPNVSAGKNARNALGKGGGAIGGAAGGALGRKLPGGGYFAPQMAAQGSELGKKAGDYIGGKAEPLVDKAAQSYQNAKDRGLSDADAAAEAGRDVGENLGDTARDIGKDLGNNIKAQADDLADAAREAGFGDVADKIEEVGNKINDGLSDYGDKAGDYLDEHGGNFGENAGEKVGGALDDSEVPESTELSNASDDVDSDLDEVAGGKDNFLGSNDESGLNGLRDKLNDTLDEVNDVVDDFKDDVTDSTKDILKDAAGEEAVGVASSVMSGVVAPAVAAGKVAASVGMKSAVPLVVAFMMCWNLFFSPEMVAQYEPKVDTANANCYDVWYNQYQQVFGLNAQNLNTGANAGGGSNAIIQRLRDIYSYQTGEAYTSGNDAIDAKYTSFSQSYFDESSYNLLENIFRIRAFFREFGLTDVQIAAMIGGMFGESVVDPTSVETVFDEAGVGADDSEALHKNGSVVKNPGTKYTIANGDYNPANIPGQEDYFATYPAIKKAGIGLIGFTDTGGERGGETTGATTDLRKYALSLDYEVKRIDVLMNLGTEFATEMEDLALDSQEYVYGDSTQHCWKHCSHVADYSSGICIRGHSVTTYTGATVYVAVGQAHPGSCAGGARDDTCALCKGNTVGGRIDSRLDFSDGADNYRANNDKVYPEPITIDGANDLDLSTNGEATHYAERWEFEDLLFVHEEAVKQFSCRCSPGCAQCTCKLPSLIFSSSVVESTLPANLKTSYQQAGLREGVFCDSCHEQYDEAVAKIKIAIAQYNRASQANGAATNRFNELRTDSNTAVSLNYEDFVRDIVLKGQFNKTIFYNSLTTEWWDNAFKAGNSKIILSKEWMRVFGKYSINSDTTDDNFYPLVKSFDDYDRKYFELWEAYAKNKNMSESNQYIHWYDLDVQLMFMLNGYRPGQLANWDGSVPEYYNIDTATTYFMQRYIGLLPVDSLPKRKEYAFAVYYLFQYESSYWRNQMAISYEDEMLDVLDKIENCKWWKADLVPNEYNGLLNVNREVTGDYSLNDRGTNNRASTLLGIVGDERNLTKMNKFGSVSNACGYVDIINNSNIAQAAVYLASPDYYTPISYTPNDIAGYPSKEYNHSPTTFYESVFRELWMSEPEENIDWWSRFKFAMGNGKQLALVDPMSLFNAAGNADDFMLRAGYMPDSQQGPPSGWMGDLSMALPGYVPYEYAQCPFCGKSHGGIDPNNPDSENNGLSPEEERECIKKRYQILWGTDVEMTYATPEDTTKPEITATTATNSSSPAGYRNVFPTPNTGSGGLLQSDVWFINTLIAWTGYDSYLYDSNVGITFHERVDKNADGKLIGEGDVAQEIDDAARGSGLTAYAYNASVGASDVLNPTRYAIDMNGTERAAISFQPVAKLADTDFITNSGSLNDNIASVMGDTAGFRNRMYSYLRVVQASEHAPTCEDPKCKGCSTPDVSGESFVRYNAVGFHEIVCYDLDDDPNTKCDKTLKNCPYHYTKNGNQRVITSRTTNVSKTTTDTILPVERVSRNSFWQEGQNDANATQYRWAEIDMDDWGMADQEIINWDASNDAKVLVEKSRAAVARFSEVLKPGDIILTDNRLQSNGQLYDDAEFIIWTGSRLVESMYPQFDLLTGSAAAYIGTNGGSTGPCIMNLSSFQALPNYGSRADHWTVFRCVKPEYDSRYRTAGFYMARLTQKFVSDYQVYKQEHPDDFGNANGYNY